MWVFIPDFGYGKINTAHYLGEAYDTPGGGPGLAMQTVEQFLGVLSLLSSYSSHYGCYGTKNDLTSIWSKDNLQSAIYSAGARGIS
jgi:hypothetical protein